MIPGPRLLIAGRAIVATGSYAKSEVHHTLIPAMDIQVASNFERYLYYLLDEDPAAVRALLAQMEQSGSMRIDADLVVLVFDVRIRWTADHGRLRAQYPDALIVYNKCDNKCEGTGQAKAPGPPGLETSALTGSGVPELLDLILEERGMQHIECLMDVLRANDGRYVPF